ncbi:biotin carboxyl carrier protein of acetyl-CoA carboxylase isoform X2 [Tripterygium wilfordii]|uniref:biotin carboxyl carrier protein of acetyl-CoA carboxylase isoform X2 n=1 Tax=Tripterygium wilfordii TaxID=458696 RepID=UPI0018F841CC|nr:biotin carboxyl carrier protein of acetyl-CoA carboxylase isoform X2 [Tripterygium wilfordii]
MASCGLGASNVKLLKLDFGRSRVGNVQQRNDLGAWFGQRPSKHARLTMSRHSDKPQRVRCSPSLVAETATSLADGDKDTKSSPLTSQLIPNSSEVESLLTEICNTTSVAEFELNLGGFRLYVLRDLAAKDLPPPPPSPAPVSVNTTAESPNSNEPVSTQSLALVKPATSSVRIQTFLERAADEGLVILPSPKVGFFRRSRTIKGKRAPPSCKEKQIVKEGQVVCYIEQLGGEIPIESDVSGEVIKILPKDGDPIGYGDALVAILPSFPGIKKLQ